MSDHATCGGVLQGDRKIIEEKLAPFVKERGYDWEVHIDETPMDLWRTHGLATS